MIPLVIIFLSLVSSLQAASCPEIVGRSEWGARAVKPHVQLKTSVSHVFIHHTAGRACATKQDCAKVARETQNFHINTNKWSDIGYSFLVGGDGRIYEGRGWKAVGAHTYGYNSKALGISFMGNFEKTKPSAPMLAAAKKLIDCGVQKGVIANNRQIHGHRDAKCTACPGAALYAIIKGWPGFKGGKLPGYSC
ncbi:hypothetical protein JTE90_017509 [Oedothorax gibbosus]|uniref:Peptidoglycan-recognition protein n=1 Tax=Oedothorax gibbosus TaxID=931172 RepID=A0AAV6UAG0_9ARAC|nr:hypothetical protein JTE90_017509 [Oedothorax gibbosus]